MLKKCSNCGKENEENINKCVYCEKELTEESVNEKSLKSMYDICYDTFVSSKHRENIRTVIGIVVLFSIFIILGVFLILIGDNHDIGFTFILLSVPVISMLEIYTILDNKTRGMFLMAQAKNMSIDKEYYQETDEKIGKYEKTRNIFIILLFLLIVSLFVSELLIKYKGLNKYILFLPYAIYIMGLIKLLYDKSHNLDNKKIQILFQIYVAIPGAISILLYFFK